MRYVLHVRVCAGAEGNFRLYLDRIAYWLQHSSKFVLYKVA